MVNAGYGKENLESVIIVRFQLLAQYGENESYNVYTYLYPSDTVVDKYQLFAFVYCTKPGYCQGKQHSFESFEYLSKFWRVTLVAMTLLPTGYAGGAVAQGGEDYWS